MAQGGCEQTAIPLLLEGLSAKGQLAGALISIDAIACDTGTAQAIRDADYLLAVKVNQSGLMGEIERFLADPPLQAVHSAVTTGKSHGRVEERHARISARVD